MERKFPLELPFDDAKFPWVDTNSEPFRKIVLEFTHFDTDVAQTTKNTSQLFVQDVESLFPSQHCPNSSLF